MSAVTSDVQPHQLIERGLNAVSRQNFNAARADFEAAALACPKLVAAHVNLGSVLWHQKHWQAAADAFNTALSVDARCADAHMNLGVIYADQGQLDTAVQHLRLGLALTPSATGYSNLGVVYRRQNKRRLALHAFEAAMAFDPDDLQHRLNCANEYLVFGEFEQGWREFGKLQPHLYSHATFPIGQDTRLWTGEYVHHLVIHHEQGFGDTIQAARYIDAASDHCDKLTFVPQAGLTTLMQHSFAHNPKITVSATVPKDYDCYQWIDSLMLRAGIDPIPAAPYVGLPATEKWRKLRTLPGLRVGLVWGGRKDTSIDERRSIPLRELNSLLNVAGVTFVSLQVHRDDERDARLYDVSPYLTDWAATAGAMRELDLVISVDTAVAHLAGAMGKPIWLLNRFDTCWRWQLDRSDSPWYPSMHIFRQPVLGDWPTVLSNVTSSLMDLVKSNQQK